jgi:hypothetical protein
MHSCRRFDEGTIEEMEDNCPVGRGKHALVQKGLCIARQKMKGEQQNEKSEVGSHSVLPFRHVRKAGTQEPCQERYFRVSDTFSSGARCMIEN